MLKNGLDPNSKINDETIFFSICRSQVKLDFKMIKLLLEHKADPNFAMGGKTPFYYICLSKKPDFETLKILFEYGADPNVVSLEGRTPFSEFCARESIDLEELKLFLEHKANPNLTDNRKKLENNKEKTPFHEFLDKYAVNFIEKYGHNGLEMLKLLIMYGANPNYKDAKGCSPFFYCAPDMA